MSKVSKEIDEAFLNKKKEICENIKKITPVKTGRLKEGWKVTDRGIENDVSYASHVSENNKYVEIATISTEGVKANGTIIRSK